MRFHPEKHTKSYTYTKAESHYNTLCSIPPPHPPPHLKIMKTMEEYEATEREGAEGGGEREKRKRLLLIPITGLLKLLYTE